MRIATAIILSCVVTLAQAASISADDGVSFHRTTPRGALDTSDGALVIGIPGGRAWGIESDLRPLPAAGGTIVVRLAVEDRAVREAFVRVAYYGSTRARSRQLSVSDSSPVEPGAGVLVAVPLDPPAGAVAYRVRVLARLQDASGRSRDGAVRARLRLADGASQPGGSLFSRLVP